MESPAIAGSDRPLDEAVQGPRLLHPQAKHLITVTLEGKTEPGGSKKGFGDPERFRGDDGKLKLKIRYDKKGNQTVRVYVKITDANENTKKRRKEVHKQIDRILAEAGYEMPHKDLPLAVAVNIFKARTVTQFGTGRNAGVLKGSAEVYPAVAPDTTKLWRALEDDLTKKLWHDDSRIVSQLVHKKYGRPRAELGLWLLPHLMRDLDGFDG